MGERSTVAVISGGVGLSAVALAMLGPGLIHLGVLGPIQGFYCFALGAVLGTPLSLGCGIAGLLRTRAGSGRTGRERAWTGIGSGVVLLLVLGNAVSAGAARLPSTTSRRTSTTRLFSP
jgi:hypothetical protein